MLSVIIPVHNRGRSLCFSLQALARAVLPPNGVEVIVVDDGSTDGSVSNLRSLGLPFSLRVVSQTSAGPAAARNRGASVARSDELVFLDADLVPSQGLLAAYSACRRSCAGAVLLGRRMPWPDAYQTLFDAVTMFEYHRDLGPLPRQVSFYHASSMNLAMRRREFESLGGFDTVLWMTEDTDLGYRASRMSIPLAYCPRAVGFHNHPRTLQQRCAQVRDSAMWTVRLFHKHPDMRGLLPVYREIEPVSWRDDGLRMIARKLGRRTIALPVFRAFMESTLRAGEAHWRNAHVLGFLYWKVLSAHRTTGFLEGLRRWGKL